MAKPLVIVESPAKAKTLGRFLGARVPRRGQLRPHPGPAGVGRIRPQRDQGEGLGAPGRGRGQRLHSLLRRPDGEEEAGRASQDRDQGRLRTAARDRPRPRRRVDQLAPDAGVEAEGAGAPHRLPRDHRRRGERGAGQPFRREREPGARPGEPAHPGPSVRLHAVAGAVEEGADRPQCRPRPERGGAADRRAGGRAPRVPLGRVPGTWKPS